MAVPPSARARAGWWQGDAARIVVGIVRHLGPRPSRIFGRRWPTVFDDSTTRVSMTSSTVYKDGTRTVTIAALKTGDLAMVGGSTSSDGTVTASTLTFEATPPGRPGN